MTLHELDEYFQSFLNFELYCKDPSKNGIQVQNAKPQTEAITKIAFAVDACTESIKKAIEQKAQVLVVHHGLFWGHEQTIVNTHYNRLKLLIENNIALYACHIPLDANNEVGNNYGLAKKLNLKNVVNFGKWNGMSIGAKGVFENPMTMEQIESLLMPPGTKALSLLQFGKKDIQTVSIVSGGAEDLLVEAIEGDMDLYITGEISHESYHTALENKINTIAAGHYNTETIGVTLLAEKLKTEKKLETFFIDIPTNL